MKYKVGDKVKIKSLDWYNENKDRYGCVNCNGISFTDYMKNYCGKILKIDFVDFGDETYKMKEDDEGYTFTNEMIEGLVEEEIITANGLQFKELNVSLEKEMEWNLPQGYQFKDENGNVINTNKIVLEKIKKEYPKTYEECCKIIHSDPKFYVDTHLYSGILETLYKLLICRGAYWKIAGEEMGLGKPWKPDFTNDDEKRYGIYTAANKVVKDFCGVGDVNTILTFPTEEMRDFFVEHFKKDIEQCKELL